MAENPFVRAGSDLIAHLKGRFFCNYRIKQGGYRVLYEIHSEQRVVWVYDADTRGQVYR